MMRLYGFYFPGYENYSTWGWNWCRDERTPTWFLQVWPNHANRDGPPMLWLYNWDRPLYPLELARLAAPRLGVSVLDVLLVMELGGRGRWDKDAYGDGGTVPRLAEAIAYERRLGIGDVLDAMVGEAGLDYHYFGGWEYDDDGPHPPRA